MGRILRRGSVSTGRILIYLLIFLSSPIFVDACCKGHPPDPTFISDTEYNLESITPNRGPIEGGTRVSISGSGFNVNFFEAGNFAYVGSDDKGWATCDGITLVTSHHGKYLFAIPSCSRRKPHLPTF